MPGTRRIARLVQGAIVTVLTAIIMVAGSGAASAEALTWSAKTPVPGTTVTTAQPLVSVRVVSEAAIWSTSGSFYIKVDGKYLRNPVLIFDRLPDGSLDMKKAVLSAPAHWAFTEALHNVEASVFASTLGRQKTTWSFRVSIPPVISNPSPAPGSTVTTLTPVIAANVIDGGPIASVGVYVDDALIPSTFTAGLVSAAVTAPLADYETHTARIVAVDGSGGTSVLDWSFDVASMPKMSDVPDCNSCHVGYPTLHPVDDCAACHGEGSPLGGGYTDPADSHAPGTSCAVCHSHLDDCEVCHGQAYPTVPPLHEFVHDTYHDSTTSGCDECHARRLTAEHARYSDSTTGEPLDCLTCHASADPAVATAIATGDTACGACHIAGGQHTAAHESTTNAACTSCHAPNLVTEHVTDHALTCATCHDSLDPAVTGAIVAGDLTCTTCHDFASHPYVVSQHTATVRGVTISGVLTGLSGTPWTYYGGGTQTYGGQTCGQCHSMDLLVEHTKPSSSVPQASCGACHPSPRDTFTTWNGTCQQDGCHATMHSDMAVRHAWSYSGSPSWSNCGSSAGGCHVGQWQPDLAAIHNEAWYYGSQFDVDLSPYANGCTLCHTSPAAVPTTPTACTNCHPQGHAAAPLP